MDSHAIREVMHRNRPFFVKAADGSEYHLRHPDFISVGSGEDGRAVIHTVSGLAILDIENITALELRETEGGQLPTEVDSDSSNT